MEGFGKQRTNQNSTERKIKHGCPKDLGTIHTQTQTG
jgi:hypothetical protein